MLLEFTAKQPENWLTHIARQFDVPIENGKINIPRSIGKGYIQQIFLFADMYLTVMDVVFDNPAQLVRKGVKNVSVYPVMFFLSDDPGSQQINGEEKQIGLHTSNGIFFPSPEINTKFSCKEKVRHLSITISTTREWLLANTSQGEEYIIELLNKEIPFFIFEEISGSMFETINTIVSSLDLSQNPKMSLTLHSLKLLSQFIKKTCSRTKENYIKNMNSGDVEKMFEVRKIIMECLDHSLTIKKMSKLVGLNQSKLQKCFKQVFGKSIYQFTLSQKMQFAKDLLETNRYSISEVGFKVGYSNLSHFTESFRKEFGMNPKAYIKNKE
jgi:AraC-like DNA-binding protein